MKIVAIGFALTKKNTELINKMIKNVLGIEQVQIIDLRSQELAASYEEDTNFIVYGKKAARLFQKAAIDYLARTKFLADLNKLESDTGNTKDREDAWYELLDLEGGKPPQKKQEEVNFTEDTLPNLTSDEVLRLEKAIIKTGRDEWVGISKEGKSFRLSTELNKTATEEIKMTFAELFAIKLTMEILHIKEIQLVSKSSKASSESDS